VSRVQELRERRAALYTEACAILDDHEKEGRDLSGEALESYESRIRQIDAWGEEIAAREKATRKEKDDDRVEKALEKERRAREDEEEEAHAKRDKRDEEDREDREEKASSAADDLSGWWEMTNTIQSTNYADYKGLRLGYRLQLDQDGDRIVGRGQKWSENGRTLPSSARTPLTVNGTIDGNKVTLEFRERGAKRTTTGSFSWTLSGDRTALRGSFQSTAADTSGRSLAVRMRFVTVFSIRAPARA